MNRADRSLFALLERKGQMSATIQRGEAWRISPITQRLAGSAIDLPAPPQDVGARRGKRERAGDLTEHSRPRQRVDSGARRGVLNPRELCKRWSGSGPHMGPNVAGEDLAVQRRGHASGSMRLDVPDQRRGAFPSRPRSISRRG